MPNLLNSDKIQDYAEGKTLLYFNPSGPAERWFTVGKDTKFTLGELTKYEFKVLSPGLHTFAIALINLGRGGKAVRADWEFSAPAIDYAYLDRDSKLIRIRFKDGTDELAALDFDDYNATDWIIRKD